MRYIIFIFILLFSSKAIGQFIYHFEKVIGFIEYENIESGYFECIIPSSYPERQAIINYVFSVNPDTIIVKDDHLIGRWNIEYFNKYSSLQIAANVIAETYNWSESKQFTEFKIEDEDLSHYLNINIINADLKKELFEFAKSLKSNDSEETIQDIYISFVKRDKRLKSISKMFPSEAGKENIFILLCRINNIPARVAIILNTDLQPYNTKYIVEVYINSRGWIPIDISDLKKNPSFKNEPSKPLFYLAHDNHKKLHAWNISGSNPNLKIEYGESLTDDINILYTEALNLYNLNELGKSLTIFKNLFKRSPKDYDTCTMIGAIYSRANQKELAKEYLGKAMDLAKRDNEKCTVNYAYANFHARQGNENLALSYLRKALGSCWFSYESVVNDVDLKGLQKNSKFLTLVESLPKDESFVAPN